MPETRYGGRLTSPKVGPAVSRKSLRRTPPPCPHTATSRDELRAHRFGDRGETAGDLGDKFIVLLVGQLGEP